MPETSRQKVLAVASRGGHWIQLLRLQDAFQDVDVLYVTTVPEYREMVSGSRFRVVLEANRHQKLRMMLLVLQMAWVVFWEGPHAIVTTGAAPGFFAIRFGRLMGARTLWIDSIANAEQLSMSGRMALDHADCVLTQWPDLSQSGGAEYRGAVL